MKAKKSNEIAEEKDGILKNNFGVVSIFLYHIGTLGIFLVFIIVFFNVFARYVFNSPFHWAEEVTAITVVLLGFFPAGELWKKRKHIKFDLVSEIINRRKPKFGIIVEIILCFLGLLFISVIIWQSFSTALMCYKINMREPTMLGTPLVIPYSFMTIGSIALFIEVFRNFINDVKIFLKGENLES